jgi:rubredoxin
MTTGSTLRIGEHTRLECRICWYVYDPAQGDAFEQIPPGTTFADLPDHWRCPQCDAGKDKFLPLDGS